MSESRPDIPIPEGLPKLMQDFVVTVLRQQPDDLLNHAVEYFNSLKVCCFVDCFKHNDRSRLERENKLLLKFNERIPLFCSVPPSSLCKVSIFRPSVTVVSPTMIVIVKSSFPVPSPMMMRNKLMMR